LTREVEPGLPVLDRLATVVAGWKEADGWAAAPPLPRTDLAFANRLDLGPLGPLGWEPTDCPTFTVTDHEGRSRSLEDYRGKNLVLVFFLGGQCAHCMQQLTLFTEKMEALRAEGTEVLAIGTDTSEATRTLATDPDVKFGMPLAADPGLDLFKRFDAHDDFEGQPLHATVLVDAEGKVRYQEVGPEPFLEVEFILSEAARVNRIVGRKVASESPRAASSASGATGGAVGAGR
jgi:peroxiredoxin